VSEAVRVAALYQFKPLPDPAAVRPALAARCCGLGLKGTLLLAPEGINGTVAGTADAVAQLVAGLRDASLLGVAMDGLELKYSAAQAMPFGRLKVRLKREIVTLGDPETDPARRSGRFVAPADWNAVLTDPDTLVLDVRNGFEVALGTFHGAVDPGLTTFSDFRAYAEQALAEHRRRRIAMFCTGGIRCEKASAWLLARGFTEVLQLRGGILNYLEQIPPAASLWRGDCFVFDERVALGPGLTERNASSAETA
jgi:UPF0176 protein